MNILERARPEILAMQPYSSARMEADAASIMLNANESPWIGAGGGDCALNRYPDPQPVSLRAALAGLYAVAPDNILIGRGSDEAIDLLVRVFCRQGCDAIAIAPPTFGMYAVAARIQGAEVIETPLAHGFVPDAEKLLAATTPHTKVVFICSPNNPTGGLVPLPLLAHLAEALRDRAMLVVDEAYIEFADGAASATALLARHDNVAVLRTLSKAHALAGARVGVLIAASSLISLLRRIQAPYPLPVPSVNAALSALSAAALAETDLRIIKICREREHLARALAALPDVLAVFDSAANFLCVRFVDAQKAYRRLMASGVVVRDVSRYPQLADCLRITIGTAEENAALLGVLDLRKAAA